MIELIGDGSKLNGFVYKDLCFGEMKCVDFEGVFVQIGFVLNIEWLKGMVELLKYGEIVVDVCGVMLVLGVFVVGDVMMVLFKQIVIVVGEGVKVLFGVFDYLIWQDVVVLVVIVQL